MAKQTPSINLVKKKEVPLIDRVISWALNVGRALVVLTEVVALSAFIYRFSLDRQIIDLHTEIAQHTTVLGFLSRDENLYRNLQDRLQQVKTLSNQEQQNLAIFTQVANMETGGVQIANFSLFKNTLRVEVIVTSPTSLTHFVQNLKQSQNFTSVSIDRIAEKPSAGQIIADITATMKK